MGKKGSLLSYVKRLFSPSSKPKPQEKSKNWRWKSREQFNYPAIKEAPPITLNEAAEEQRKRAVAIAVATAAAADAAVSAANSAAEVVRLANKPKDVERRILHLAAVEIQAAYRGHLARKALSALKGIVKLQAVVRGELVRTKAQPLLVHRNRVQPLLDYLCHGENRRSFVLNDRLKNKEFKLKCNTHRSFDLSSVPNEANTKREFTRRYSFSHWERRNNHSIQEAITVKRNTSTRFDQLAETEELKPTLRMKTVAVDTTRLEKLKLKTTRKNETVEDSNSSYSQHRRSLCHAKQKSIGDFGSLPNSPVFPAYMAATESTKAKSRSFSTPRQRMRLCEMNYSLHSPYNLLSISSCGPFNVK